MKTRSLPRAQRTLSASGIVVVSFLALLAGHLLLKYYMPNSAVGGLGFALVGLIFFYVLFIRRAPFGFVLVVYICSHFAFGDNQGGLWNLMAFGILAAYLVANRRQERFPRPDPVMTVLISVFILLNILGWGINNPLPLVPRLQGIAALFGFILMFRLASSMTITKERARLFLSVTFFMLIYELVVALNQHYAFIKWNTPFLGSYTDRGSSITQRVASTPGSLHNFELLAEYGAIMAGLLVPMLSSSLTQRELRFGSSRVIIMIVASLLCITLTGDRSGAILFSLVNAAYLLVLPLGLFASIDRVGRQFRILMVAAFLLPLVGAYFGLSHLEHKFSALSGKTFSITGIVSGKDINRGALVSMGLRRLASRSWWVGYGYGVPRSNRWAWFGVDPKTNSIMLDDFHSLYLTLPELYGWIGALAFISMIVVTGFRAFTTSLRYRQRKSFLIPMSIGFAMMWGVFLTNEYKITVLRDPNYYMIFWIWLGLANAVIRTIRYQTLMTQTSMPSPSRRTLPKRIAEVAQD